VLFNSFSFLGSFAIFTLLYYAPSRTDFAGLS